MILGNTDLYKARTAVTYAEKGGFTKIVDHLKSKQGGGIDV